MRLPTGAFVRERVRSAAQLLEHLRTDPVVRRRYEIHFGLGARGVIQMLGSLRPKRLSEDHVLSVYYVHPGEHYGSRPRRLRRGTPVFVQRNGTPLLIVACGNPLMRFHPAPMPSAGLPPEMFVPDYSTTEPLDEPDPTYVDRPASPPRMIAEAMPLFAPVPESVRPTGSAQGSAPLAPPLPGTGNPALFQYAQQSYGAAPGFSMTPWAAGALTYLLWPPGPGGNDTSPVVPPGTVPPPPAPIVIAIGAAVWWIGLKEPGSRRSMQASAKQP